MVAFVSLNNDGSNELKMDSEIWREFVYKIWLLDKSLWLAWSSVHIA